MKPSFTALFALSSLVLLASCGGARKAEAPPETGPVEVRAAQVRTQTIARTVESVGTLFPYDEAIISAEIAGPVVEVKADLGDAVREGDLLARISDEEQRYLVAQQEAQLRQSLERLGLSKEDDRVKDIRETPDVRRASADLREAEQRFKRTRELVDQGIGARADLDSTQARFQSLQAAYDVTLNQTRNLIQEVERFKAGLQLQRKRLRDTSVRAPFDALVKERQVTAGQFVQANNALFTLVKINPIRLRLEIPERMAPWVKTGQTAEVSVEAFDDRTFQGKIWRISPTVDQTKRTFVVEALIDNARGELKPGSYARARLQTDRTDAVRLIPARALNYVLGTNKAYVIKGDQTIEVRDVKVGDRFPEEVEIVEGVEDGERLAMGPLNRLEEGVAVRVSAGKQAAK
ncbi:MAG: efflux RND transporter periplasmic adaptor subunit [Bryobacteraceae bacterium]|nr:efflux RND transporter periplasmic adaptor subunit [Bryobacteraceae bacterium]